MTVDPAKSLPVSVGDVLAGKYRVARVLGAGGMGVVVEAMHLDLQQRVALKFLLPDAASDALLIERFLREARASVRLKSPHVARTLDTGRLESGSPYIVMEFLEGNDLSAELLSRGALPVEEAASYVLQTCDALAEAHTSGIVHRDLKPANLFLVEGADGRAQLKVLDFGISKIQEYGEQRGVTLTSTEMVFGSPAYMSPEQMRSSKDVDASSDIWSLGVVLYEILTSRLPFEAPTAMALAFMHAGNEAPTKPTTHRKDLPLEVEQIILRCLEKDPAKRFANVGELALALAPFAPPRDRALAERVADIVAPRAPRGSRSLNPSATPPPESDPRALGKTQLAVATESSALREGSRSRIVFGMLGLFAIVGIAVVLNALRGRDPAAPVVPASTAPAETAPVASPVPMPTTPDEPPPPTVSSAASASASPAAPQHGLPPSHAKTTHGGAAQAPVSAAPAPVPPPPAPVQPTAASADAGRYYRVRE